MHAAKTKKKRMFPQSLSVSNLKLCPLCDSLNARTNKTCFVCGWKGEFGCDPRKLHTALVLLIERCPELAEYASIAPPRLTFKEKVSAFFSRQRRIDLSA